MTLLEIQQALEMATDDILSGQSALIPRTQIQFGNMAFKPSPGVPWAKVSVMHAKRSPASAGINSFTRAPGILQISLFFPEGRGLAAPLQAAQALLEGFPRGARFARGSGVVRIEGSSIGPHIHDGAWVMTPVSVNWLVYSQD